MAAHFRKYSESTLKSKSRYDLISIIETSYRAYDRDKELWKQRIRDAGEVTMEWMTKTYELEAQLETVKKELEETRKKLDEVTADPAMVSDAPKGGRPRIYDNAVRETVRELHKKGLTVRKIAVSLNMSPATVSRIIKALPSTGG